MFFALADIFRKLPASQNIKQELKNILQMLNTNYELFNKVSILQKLSPNYQIKRQLPSTDTICQINSLKTEYTVKKIFLYNDQKSRKKTKHR